MKLYSLKGCQIATLFLNRWFLAIVGFITLRFILGYTTDLSPTCHSGWSSPSIGSRGACSWHGGVDRSALTTANLVSLIFACFILFIHWFFSTKDERTKKSEKALARTEATLTEQRAKELAIPAPGNITPCPIHGPMISLPDRYCCTKYPACQYFFLRKS